MGRPPMPVGTAGKINILETDGGFQARCKFRDYDGKVRLVSKSGKTQTAASNALKLALVTRQQPGGAGVTRDTRLEALAEMWLADVEASNLSTGTKQHYRYVADSYVKPALGALRVGEATVAPIDRALTVIRQRHGQGSAKSARSVLSGMLGLAARHDAIAVNPVRDTSAIKGVRSSVRALTPEQADDICDRLRADQRAIDLDLPDLVEYMLATGARIGEVCAARSGVNADGKQLLDLKAGTWEVNATVIRVKGRGLVVQERPKTAAGWRVLALPSFAVAMIERRRSEARLTAPSGVVFGSPKVKALRDPSNTPGDLRAVLDSYGYEWVTSHVFRKTVATRMDEAGFTARQIADQLGHARPSLTQDVYMGRQVVNADVARLLDR